MCAELEWKANVHSLCGGRALLKGMGAAELICSCSTDAGKDNVTGPAVEELQKTLRLFRGCWLDLGMPAQMITLSFAKAKPVVSQTISHE
jgi:hypothetical protein